MIKKSQSGKKNGKLLPALSKYKETILLKKKKQVESQVQNTMESLQNLQNFQTVSEIQEDSVNESD